jgi:hypothetical protein
MKILPIILGVLTSLVTSVSIFIFDVFTGRSIHTMFIFFVLPFGSLLVGMGSGCGFYLGSKLANTKPQKLDIIFVIVFGILSFFTVIFFQYSFSFCGYDSKDNFVVVTKLSKPENFVPISDQIEFSNYVNIINTSSEYSFTPHGVKTSKGVEIGETATTFLFYVQILGAALGSLSMGLMVAQSRYCDKCQKYYKSNVLKKFNLEKFDQYAISINTNISDGKALKKLINEFDILDDKKNTFGQIDHLYCPSCYESLLVVKFFKKQERGEPIEIDDSKQMISIDESITRELLN